MLVFTRSATQSSLAVQPIAVTNPFGTLPAIQMSIGRAGTAPSIQYGISSLPVNMTSLELLFLFFKI